jgi:hypothetical protein
MQIEVHAVILRRLPGHIRRWARMGSIRCATSAEGRHGVQFTQGGSMRADTRRVGRGGRRRLAPRVGWYLGVGACLIALPIVACSSASEPDERGVVAIVDRGDGWTDGTPIIVPDTVQAGEPFVVEVVTFGTKMCSRTGETEVVEEVGTVRITPYNYRILRDSCPRMYQKLIHHLQLVVEDPGSLTLRVVGWDAGTDQLITREKEVIVREAGS